MLAVILVSVTAISFGGSTASALTPEEVVEGFIDAVNAGDGAGIAASFTDDGSFEDIDGGSFGIFGMAALQFGFTDLDQEGIQVTLTSTDVEGDTVTGTVEYTDNITAAAGVDRVIQPFVAEISGDKIASLVLRYDTSDAQTATYLEYQASQEDEDEGPEPSEFVELKMEGNQTGDAGVGSFEDVSFVFIGVEPGAAGVEQPSAIRSGTCDDLGGIVQGLAPVLDGNMGSIISMNLDDLLASDHTITVSDSADNAGVIVSCADIERGATTGGPTLPSTGTGGSTGMGLSWLIATLALVGVGGLAGAATLAARRR